MDHLYINRILNGETDAFKYLVRNHENLAMRTAMSIVKNETYSKDVVQNSFLQAYESLDKFRGESAFSTWFCRIVINKSLKFVQKNKRYESGPTHELQSERISYNSALLTLHKEDLQNFLKKGIAKLSPKEALCIQLFYLEEFSIEEIVELTGFSTSNTKVLLYRGRKNLHEYLLTDYKKINSHE